MSVATVVAAGGAPWEGSVVRALEDSDDVQLVRRCVDLADLLAVVPVRSPRVAVVATELVGLGIDVVEELRSAGVSVVAVGDPALADVLGVAARVGPTEVVRAVTRVALEDVEQVEPAAPAPPARGRVLAVWGPAGGPGRSTVAAALAGEAALRGRRVLLADADVQGGTQAQTLGLLDDTSGLLAACREVNQGRVDDAQRHAVAVDVELTVLTGLARADMWPQLRVAALERLLSSLRATHDLVVVDLGPQLGDGGGPRGAGDAARAVLDLADDVLVVGRADPPGLTRLVRALHEVAELRLDPESVHVVLNRSRRSIGWSTSELTDTVLRLTGHRPVAVLPDDPDAVDVAGLTGRLLQRAASTSRLAVAVRSLLDELQPPGLTVSTVVKSGALSRVLTRQRRPGGARRR